MVALDLKMELEMVVQHDFIKALSYRILGVM
jgi:hypothetical protein